MYVLLSREPEKSGVLLKVIACFIYLPVAITSMKSVKRARKEVGERDRCQAYKTLNITSSLNISASVTSGFHQ